MITIILLISGVALTVVSSALSHREADEATRLLNGALVGARDRALALGRPAGVRLLPDPDLLPIAGPLLPNGSPNPRAGRLDPNGILAYDRIVPIESPPEYSEGMCTPYVPGRPGSNVVIPPSVATAYPFALILLECDADPRTGAPNPPTSWFWNIRVGDRVQIGNAGDIYTVIGPVATDSSGLASPEQFVGIGPPAPIGAYAGQVPTVNGQPVEFLLLANGVDDNKNGFVDDGFDGIDNNGNGTLDANDISEWTPALGGEAESWLGSIATHAAADVPYAIRRRPAPSSGAREVALPRSTVIDATTAFLTRERSRLPVNPITGAVDVVLNPDGTVLPTTVYSSPSSFGMDAAFYHFWIADRGDLAPPATKPDGTPLGLTGNGSSPLLPIARPGGSAGLAGYGGPYLEGKYSLVSLNARTGNIAVNPAPPFLYDATIGYNSQAGAYQPYAPFIQAEQGSSGSP